MGNYWYKIKEKVMGPKDHSRKRPCPDSDNASVPPKKLAKIDPEIAPPDAIVALPEEICCICLEILQPHEDLDFLPCSHGYHRVCIIQWLQVDDSCPICRVPVSTDLCPHCGQVHV